MQTQTLGVNTTVLENANEDFHNAVMMLCHFSPYETANCSYFSEDQPVWYILDFINDKTSSVAIMFFEAVNLHREKANKKVNFFLDLCHYSM